MEILNIDERNELERCEVVIKQGLETFIEVGQALMTIRDKRLYRIEFTTFEDYCRDKWAISRRSAYQYIEASNAIENVRHGAQILPTTERQARPLTSLEPEIQREAWKEVVQQSQATGQPITATKVQEVANTFKQARETYREVKAEQRKEQLEQKTTGITIPIDQLERINKLKAGETVVLNMNTDLHLLRYAQENGLYIRCDRFSDWGNPFVMGTDGDRDEVCDNFMNFYLPHKHGLMAKISTLKGKALGCHCYPARCHCETLKILADETTN